MYKWISQLSYQKLITICQDVLSHTDEKYSKQNKGSGFKYQPILSFAVGYFMQYVLEHSLQLFT